jgi:arylsulfatase A-like enzyme
MLEWPVLRASLRAQRCAALVVLALTAFGCGPTNQDPTRPNLVLITLDTTRTDHLSTYGYFRETSPFLDELARESLVFERLIVPIAVTLPTHISILTGTHPLEHGVLANTNQGGARFVPSPLLRSFATLSQQAGYATGGFVSAVPLRSGSGAETGFDVYSQPEAKSRPGNETADSAIAWLRKLGSQPFFLWVHFYDAHYPYQPPQGFAGRFSTDDALEAYIAKRRIHDTAFRPGVNEINVARDIINLYDAEILFADTQLGRILDALRARKDWDNTAVVVAGDHGEGLCQHGLAAHGSTWNEQLHAPLVIRVPGQAPRRIDTPLSSMDVLPTLMSLAPFPQAEPLLAQATGRNVLDKELGVRVLLSRDTGRERKEDVPFRWALGFGRWKLFRLEYRDGRVTEELYDLESDPHELHDVARVQPERVKALSKALIREIELRRKRGLALRDGNEPATRAEDPAVLEQLKALGYVVDEE